ncbi:MAG: hypothetical protein ACKOXP_03210 [Flavobacteriales bacterium]
MKFLSRICIFLCALGVFLNVTLSNVLHAHVVKDTHSTQKSKQVAFRKVSENLSFNVYEFEEDVELDEDGGDFQHTIFWSFTEYQSPEISFKHCVASKFSYYTHHERWERLPLFVQFQNFRI